MGSITRRTALQGSIGAIALAATGQSANAQDSKAIGVNAQTIRLGQMVALTGAVANYGIPIKAGTSAYLSLVNSKGGVNGRKIELISEDNAFSTPQSLTISRRLAAGEGIFALINSMGTAQINAVIPYLLDQEKTPIFGTYGGAVEWFNPSRPGLFGLQVLYEDLAGALGRWTAKDGFKKVVAVHIEGATFAKAAKAVEPAFKAVTPGGTVELLPVKLPTQDHAPIALQIIQSKPDAIIGMLTETEFVSLARALKSQGSTIPIYAWGPVVTLKALELGGASMDGVKAFSWTASPQSDGPAVVEYRAAMQKYAPQEKIDFVSLFNFGQTKIFVEALSRVKGPLTRESFYTAIESMKGYDSGIFPPVNFAPDRHQGLSQLIPLQVKSGGWSAIGAPIDTANQNW